MTLATPQEWEAAYEAATVLLKDKRLPELSEREYTIVREAIAHLLANAQSTQFVDSLIEVLED